MMLHLNNTTEPHLGHKIMESWAPLSSAKKVMILIHGRGSNAESMLDLSNALQSSQTAYIIPQAAGFTWYPLRFLEKRAHNEPGLSSALNLIHAITTALLEQGFDSENIYFLGFSQGACLAADYTARHTKKYGGVFVLSGGLIGDQIDPDDYKGNLLRTPVFLGCSAQDFHIPEERVHKSALIFDQLNAAVTTRIYPNMGHTIQQDEIDFVNNILAKK